jgi:peptide/nickel transport system substrate-binding protein
MCSRWFVVASVKFEGKLKHAPHIACPGLAVALLFAATAAAATRPHYGGTLRVEMHRTPPSPEAFGIPRGFVLTTWESGRRAVFSADENAPGGRPFLDSIEIQMARALRDQSVDLELGKADIVELGPNELRRQAAARRVWSSSPVRLMALVFGPRIADARVREALALAVDRTAIHSVLLQKQGDITGALLPEWLTGYAFLFHSAADLVKARGLVTGAPVSELRFSLTPEDPANRAIADRIALNARDAGLMVSVAPFAPNADVRLVEARIGFADAPHALANLAAALGLNDPPPARNPEESYASERALLEDFRVIPLFHLPDVYGASLRVRGGPVITPLGEFRFDSLWVDDRP